MGTITRISPFSILSYCLLALCLAGCIPNQHDAVEGKSSMKPVKYYLKQLKNEEFIWTGVTSNEDRIPSIHAARALVILGDAAVPGLLAAAGDDEIERTSIFDALNEIGIPMDGFRTDFFQGDVERINAWWEKNGSRTIKERTDYRKSIGLPAPNLYTDLGQRIKNEERGSGCAGIKPVLDRE